MKKKNTAWIRLEEVDSTNDYAKQMREKGQDLFITAKRQTGGRGTKGRSFSSNEGGAYLTHLRFYENFPAKQAFLIMAGAAVAVCEIVESYGLTPVIKWPNDIFVKGKKLCGILIENTFSGGNISSSIVGIGLNVQNKLPEELQDIATTIKMQTGKVIPVDEVLEKLSAALLAPPSMEKYRARVGYLGEEVTVILGDERIPATLLSVTDEGRLRVKIRNEEVLLSAGEVSIRV